MRIDIYSDTVCPWCYLGKRRFDLAVAARPQYEPRVIWRPFELNPDVPVEGVDRADLSWRRRWRIQSAWPQAHAELERQGEASGIRFSLRSDQPHAEYPPVASADRPRGALAACRPRSRIASCAPISKRAATSATPKNWCGWPPRWASERRGGAQRAGLAGRGRMASWPPNAMPAVLGITGVPTYHFRRPIHHFRRAGSGNVRAGVRPGGRVCRRPRRRLVNDCRAELTGQAASRTSPTLPEPRLRCCTRTWSRPF